MNRRIHARATSAKLLHQNPPELQSKARPERAKIRDILES
jgi:hypothetical protein